MKDPNKVDQRIREYLVVHSIAVPVVAIVITGARCLGSFNDTVGSVVAISLAVVLTVPLIRALVA